MTALVLVLSMTCSCVKDFVPVTSEYNDALIIEALITDQPATSYVRLSMAYSLWKRIAPKFVKGCTITFSDDLGNVFPLIETSKYGLYMTYPDFRGVTGREYTLHVKTNKDLGFLTYESVPVMMKSVPPIDSLYYHKKTIENSLPEIEGCDIFLDTHDLEDKCNFYKWDYTETWEFHFPFKDNRKICWTSVTSENILIKTTKGFSDNRIRMQPVISINNPVDRLSVKYSILVRQYSLNEDEFLYWDRLKNSTDNSGGLYDIIPSEIPNNLFCVEDSKRKILGYFSVSAVTTKRLFIEDIFQGSYPGFQYIGCLRDTIITNIPDTIPGLYTSLWILEYHTDKKPPFVICTRNNDCVFCEVRGTSIMPEFWNDDK